MKPISNKQAFMPNLSSVFLTALILSAGMLEETARETRGDHPVEAAISNCTLQVYRLVPHVHILVLPHNCVLIMPWWAEP